MISKERGEDLRSKISSGVGAEIDVLKLSTTPAPAAVVPGTHHEIYLMVVVGLLERLIHRERAVHIFLIPPSTNDQRRHGRVLEIKVRRFRLPVRVPRRMLEERFPRM